MRKPKVELKLGKVTYLGIPGAEEAATKTLSAILWDSIKRNPLTAEELDDSIDRPMYFYNTVTGERLWSCDLRDVPDTKAINQAKRRLAKEHGIDADQIGLRIDYER